MQRELEVAIEAARAGGAVVRKYYKGEYDVHEKAPDNPLTIADTEADAIIKKTVLSAFPDDGWLSEETADTKDRLTRSRVWIVDPLDGTKEFTQHIPEFCVCVAFVVDGVVQVGVSYNPAEDLLFAARRGGGTTLNGEPVRCTPQTEVSKAVVLASRSEDKRGEWDAYKPLMQVKLTGSVAYKFALIAAGQADATFSLTPKNEWDICAGTMLVEEAGGVVTDRYGKPLTFNNEKTLLPGLIAASSTLYGPLRDIIKKTSGE
ncbi:MAG TPA: 3'(2'),5'-bisphosphate nucleotidase CysQ [Candidatus Limnocylindrales bacterium]|nr:3'(2'),5'-bisphosphate nucleotidase CysQ [Candidatus Limnocylindrales bacterium]